MATIKCKMCGGTVEFQEGASVGVCDSCGTQQTLPACTDEVLTNLFNRANNLRIACDFDKAAEIYEKIIEQKDTEAEAYWGLVLCKYGIEYVEDPATQKRIPTCHRTLFEPITTDYDYQMALKYADIGQRVIYSDEAQAIDLIQRKIINVARNEEPFDVFICYKETDEYGKRTIDSTLANDIYYQLTQEGLKVFYSAITLEDKLGQEYEPYIFSALNSAKVMLVVGTKPEHFNAVWVKNEWSRYLKLMKKDRNRTLIPCYRDMDAYNLPEEFAHLQAQDMSKIGFINDIVRGIKKLMPAQDNYQQPNQYANAQYSQPYNQANENVNRQPQAAPVKNVQNAFDKISNTVQTVANSDAVKQAKKELSAPPGAKNKWVALLLCIFLGYFGFHKFYEGKFVMGVIYLFTGGFFVIGVIFDFFKILVKPKYYYVKK